MCNYGRDPARRALAGAIAWLAFHREILQSTTLEQQLRDFRLWSPILFVLLYSLATVLFVPGSILTVAGGALFGPLWGGRFDSRSSCEKEKEHLLLDAPVRLRFAREHPDQDVDGNIVVVSEAWQRADCIASNDARVRWD